MSNNIQTSTVHHLRLTVSDVARHATFIPKFSTLLWRWNSARRVVE
ncbi:MAG: hypothetical protein R2932_01575 [Caldilineaceae bacterium]